MDARKEYEQSARRANALAHQILEVERNLDDADMGATAFRVRDTLRIARIRYYEEAERARFFGSLLD